MSSKTVLTLVLALHSIFFQINCYITRKNPISPSYHKIDAYSTFHLNIPDDSYVSAENDTITTRISENPYIVEGFENPKLVTTVEFCDFVLVEVFENTLFVANQYLKIFDITDPLNPFFVSKIPLLDDSNLRGSGCAGMSVSVDLLVVACGWSGVLFFNVSNRYSPVKITTFKYNVKKQASSLYESVVLSSDSKTLYLSDAGDGWKIVDVSIPSKPVILYNGIERGYLIELDENRNVVFVVRNGAVHVFNVTNKIQPVQRSRLLFNDVQSIQLGEYYAVITGTKIGGGQSGIYVVDTEILKTTLSTIGPPIGGRSEYALLRRDIWYGSVKPSYGQPITGLLSIDFSNITRPVKGPISTSYTSTVMSIAAISDDFIVQGLKYDGFRVLNISGGVLEEVFRTNGTKGGNQAKGIELVSGDVVRSVLFDKDSGLLYAGCDNSLMVFRLQKDHLTRVEGTEFHSEAGQFDTCVVNFEMRGRKYLVTASSRDFYFYSIDSIEEATFVTKVAVPRFIDTCAVNPDLGLLVLGLQFDGLGIFDISNITNVTLLHIGARTSTNDYITRIAFSDTSDDVLFTACSEMGIEVYSMKIYNISNSSLPDLISTTPFHSTVTDIYVENGYAFVGTGVDGVAVFDITNPHKPIKLSEINTKDARQIKKQRNLLFVSNYHQQVDVIDVNDLENMKVISNWYMPQLEGIDVSDNLLFVAGSSTDIELVRFSTRLVSGKDFSWLCGTTSLQIIGSDGKTSLRDEITVEKMSYCSNGVCLPGYRCECYDGYEGLGCDSFSCGAPVTSADTCSGNGKCVGPSMCLCDALYGGELCQNYHLYSDVILPVGSLTGTVMISLFVMVSLILCCGICCVSLTVLFCMCSCCFCLLFGFCVVVGRLLMSVKKYKKLDNFDLLLKEQLLDKRTSVPHLRFNKKLFEVDWDDIDTVGVLGRGGSNSVVYKAKWKGSIIAFKCFKTRTLMTDQVTFDEFEKEVELLSSLSHPNIIRFFGACLNPTRVGILMELCSNGELFEFVVEYREKNQMRYPMIEILRLLSEVASALSFLHAKKIIHRDLKCENVLVSEDFSAKLMDFGLSRLIENQNAARTKRIGTSLYMAPEIVNGNDIYYEAIDCFSFAILAYILITENPQPYGGEGSMLIELKVANNPNFRPPVKLLHEALSSCSLDHWDHEWIETMIVECWNHDPQKRWDCSRIQERLEEEIRSLSVESDILGLETEKLLVEDFDWKKKCLDQEEEIVRLRKRLEKKE